MGIIGLGGIGAYDKSGFADDPNKPKSIDRIEIKVEKWFRGLKRGWTNSTMYSPVLFKLRNEWENEVEKNKHKWKPKYNFGDILA